MDIMIRTVNDAIPDFPLISQSNTGKAREIMETGFQCHYALESAEHEYIMVCAKLAPQTCGFSLG